ncbi:hypothetical protein D9M68_257430 [compost metagenome]
MLTLALASVALSLSLRLMPLSTTTGVLPAPSGSTKAVVPPVVVSSGASLTAATTMLKVAETVPPWPSSAITWRLRVPASLSVGVPLKVRVAASKLSQAGRAPPPASWAL